MNTLIRSGIVTVAGAVAVGALGVGVAGAAQSDDNDPVLKREDTSNSLVVTSADTDDDNGDLDDGPTTNTANSVNSTNTANSVNSTNTANSANSKNTANSVNSKNTANSVNSSNSRG